MSQVPMIAPLGCSLMEVHRFEKKLKKVEEKIEKIGETSQELRMLSTVTINCQVGMID